VSSLGSFGAAGGLGAAIFGIGGGGGIAGSRGGTGAGILGMGGAAKPPAGAALGAACASPSPAVGSFELEIICVYGLGPDGGATGAGAGSAERCINAPVAPSPGRDEGFAARGLSTETGGDGIGMTTGSATGAEGATNIGACGVNLGSFGDGGVGSGSIEGGITPPGVCTGGLNVGCGFPMSLNSPVKLLAEALFPGALSAGGADACPNMAVNSPTLLRGGSIGSEENAGTSAGASPRNGPWKKLVNSPGLGPSLEAADGNSGEAGFGLEKDSGILSLTGGAEGFTLEGSHGAG